MCVCGNWFGTKNGAQTLVGGFLQEIRAESRLICYCTSWQRTPILVGATPAEAVYQAKAQDGGIGKVFPKLRFVYTKAIQLHKVCVNAPPRYWSGRCHNHHSSEIRGFCLMKWIFFEHKNQHIQSIFPPLINASTSRSAKKPKYVGFVFQNHGCWSVHISYFWKGIYLLRKGNTYFTWRLSEGWLQFVLPI